MSIYGFAWSTPTRKWITSTAGAIAAVAGAIAAVPPAWSALGLPVVATRVFVHDQVQPLQVAQADTTKTLNQLLLYNLESQLYQAKKDQVTAPSPTVDQRVEQLNNQINEVKGRMTH